MLGNDKIGFQIKKVSYINLIVLVAFNAEILPLLLFCLPPPLLLLLSLLFLTFFILFFLFVTYFLLLETLVNVLNHGCKVLLFILGARLERGFRVEWGLSAVLGLASGLEFSCFRDSFLLLLLELTDKPSFFYFLLKKLLLVKFLQLITLLILPRGPSTFSNLR